MTAQNPNTPVIRLRNLPPVLREDGEDPRRVRIVSVSATAPGEQADVAGKNTGETVEIREHRAPPTIHAPAPDDASGAFLAPRVLDQRAFDELAGTLRSLIDEAAASRTELRDALERLAQSDSYASTASQHLQERLRLSARMLKAFQSQIERAEHTAERIESQQASLNEVLQRLDETRRQEQQRADQAADAFRARLDELVGEAVDSFRTRVNDVRATMNQSDERLDDVAARLASLESDAQDMETHLHALRTADARRRDQFERAAAVAETTAQRCFQAQRTLVEHLNETDSRIDQQHAHGRRISEELRALIERQSSLADTARQRLDAQYARIDPAFMDHLQSLLDRLEPWRSLVDASSPLEPDAIPPAFANVMSRLRATFDADVHSLADAMRRAADVMTARPDRTASPRDAALIDVMPAVKRPVEVATIEHPGAEPDPLVEIFGDSFGEPESLASA